MIYCFFNGEVSVDIFFTSFMACNIPTNRDIQKSKQNLIYVILDFPIIDLKVLKNIIAILTILTLFSFKGAGPF